jgi:hypothetical protein
MNTLIAAGKVATLPVGGLTTVVPVSEVLRFGGKHAI